MLFPADGKTPNMKQRAELRDCKPWDPIHSGAVTPIFSSLEDTFFTFSLLSKRVSRQSLWILSHRHFPSPPAGQGKLHIFQGWWVKLCMSVLLWVMIVETVPKDVFLLPGQQCRTLTISNRSFGKDIRGVFAESGDTLYLLCWLQSSLDKQNWGFSEVAFELSQRELNYFTFDCDPGFQMLAEATTLHCSALYFTSNPVFSYAMVKKLIWNIWIM